MAGSPKERFEHTLRTIRRCLAPVALFSFAINVLILVSPIYLMQLFDRVLVSQSSETLVVLTVLAIGAFVVMGALEMVRSRILVRLSRWMDRRLGPDLVEVAVDKGGISAQGLRDLAALRSFVTGAGALAFLDVPWVPVFLALIFVLHPWLGVVATAGALVLFALTILNEWRTGGPMKEANEAFIRAQSRAEAGVRNADTIRAMGMLPAFVARWDEDNRIALEGQLLASDRGGSISAATKAFRQILQTAILAVGAWLALDGRVSPGVMIAASIAMGRALAPVEQVIATWKSTLSARHAYRRLRDMVDEAPEDMRGMSLPAPRGHLSVENISLQHEGSVNSLLRSVSFSLEPGEIMAVVGATGTGKSSLGRLLVGIARPTGGSVRLDGADVAAWPSEDRGRHIGYLPQEPSLFRGTVRENIARLADAPAEWIVAAARKAHVHEMILRLPKGYETEIGEGGIYLSGGQRQRIALARALFGDPKLLVLDEPNASLDEEGEEALVKALQDVASGGAAVVVITHRPDVLRVATKMLRIENGVGRLAVRTAPGARTEETADGVALASRGRPGMSIVPSGPPREQEPAPR